MKVLMLNLFLMALWVASTGEFTYSNALLGFVIAFIALYWLRGMFRQTSYFQKVPLALKFAGIFAWEMLLANLRVAWEVVTPTALRRPGIVGVPLEARTDLEIAILANIVSLTPGSLSIDVSPDRKTLYVHTMFVDDPEEFRREIKENFESWIVALLR